MTRIIIIKRTFQYTHLETTFISRKNSTGQSLRGDQKKKKKFLLPLKDILLFKSRVYSTESSICPMHEWPLQVLYWKDHSMHRVERSPWHNVWMLRVSRKISTEEFTQKCSVNNNYDFKQAKKRLLLTMYLIYHLYILTKKEILNSICKKLC